MIFLLSSTFPERRILIFAFSFEKLISQFGYYGIR